MRFHDKVLETSETTVLGIVDFRETLLLISISCTDYVVELQKRGWGEPLLVGIFEQPSQALEFTPKKMCVGCVHA